MGRRYRAGHSAAKPDQTKTAGVGARNPDTGRSQISELLLQCVDDLVEGCGRAHDRGGLFLVRPVVAAKVGSVALGVQELLVNHIGVVAQVLGDRAEDLGQLGVVGLGGQRLCPEQGEPEVGAAVVDLVDLAGRGLAFVEKLLGGLVQRGGQDADALRKMKARRSGTNA